MITEFLKGQWGVENTGICGIGTVVSKNFFQILIVIKLFNGFESLKIASTGP